MKHKLVIIGLIILIAFLYGDTYGAGALGYLMGSLTIMAGSLFFFATVLKKTIASIKEPSINWSRELHKLFVLLCFLWVGYMVYIVIKEPSYIVASEPTMFITSATLVPAVAYVLIRLLFMPIVWLYRGFKKPKEGT
jgi:hypothetical protein